MRAAGRISPSAWAIVAVLAAACGSSDATSPGPGSTTDALVETSGDAIVDAPDASESSDGSTCSDASISTSAPWSRSASNPLYLAGTKDADGRYELSIGDPKVIWDDADAKYQAWWSTGLAATFGDADPVLVIKYAESTDGVHWTVQAEPAIESHVGSGDWDYTHVETPSVVVDPSAPADRRYKLYYSGGNKQLKAADATFPWYSIGLAFSPDGKHFTRLPLAESPYATASIPPYTNLEGLDLYWKDALPSATSATDGVVADPDVVLVGGVYRVYFSSYAVNGTTPLFFGVSTATSSDGIHWTGSSSNPLAGLNGQTPSVIWNDAACRYELWWSNDSDADKAAVTATYFATRGFFHATSGDGEHFTVDVGAARDFEWDGAETYEEYGLIFGPTVLLRDGTYSLYYVGWGAGTFPPGFVVPTHDTDSSKWPAGGLQLLLAQRAAR